MVLKVADAIPDFTEYLTGRGLSAGTVKRHRVAASGFVTACQRVKGHGATMGQIDPQCVSKFFAAHTGGQGSRNNKIESLRHFLRWAEKNRLLRPGFTADELLDGYKSRKAERAPKYYLSSGEFPAALEAAGQGHPADRAVIALALFTLARQSEIAALRLCDIDFIKGEIRIYRGKLKRWTVTGVTRELDRELATWLAFYAREMGYFSSQTMAREHPDWLLVPSRGRGNARLQPTQPICVMERIAKRVLSRLGVQGTRQGKSSDHLGEGMHTFRRSGARAFLKALSEGLGHQRALVQVSLMLDHDDIRMTLRYIGVEQERDELNEWLKGNDMYLTPEPPPMAAVVPLRSVV